MASSSVNQPTTEVASDVNHIKARNAVDSLMSRKVRLAKPTTFPPKSQLAVRVLTQAAGLCCLHDPPRTAMRRLATMFLRVMDIVLHQPFTVCASSFRAEPTFSKRTALDISLPSPAHTLPADSAISRVTEHKKREEPRNKGTSKTSKANTWGDEACVSLDDDDVRQKVLWLLRELHVLCGGRFEETDATGHLIERMPCVK